MQNKSRRIGVLGGAAMVACAAIAARADISGFSGFAPVNVAFDPTSGTTSDSQIGYKGGGSSFLVTGGQNGEAVSGWNPAAQSMSSFVIDYNYQTIPQFTYAGNGGNSLEADGLTVAFQNPTTGSTTALGGGGGALGYAGAPATGYAGGALPSGSAGVGYELFNGFYSYQGGSELLSGGAQGSVSDNSNIDISTGDLMKVHISYANGTLTQSIMDTTTGQGSAHTYGINLASVLGSGTGLVGITGGTGGFNVTQTVTNFSFKTVAPMTYAPLAVSGFNQAMIVPAGTTNVAAVVTATMDSGTSKTGYTFYEQGDNASAPTTGLPTSGSTFVSQNDPSHVFQMQSYAGNDALLLTAGSTTGTLALATQVSASALSILAADGNGTQGFNVLVTYVNGNTQLLTPGDGAVSPDWFFNAPVAYDAEGRVSADDNSFDSVNGGDPNLYQIDLLLNDTTDPIKSLAFTYEGASNSNSSLAIYGVSAAPGTAVPEPASLGLIGLGAIGLLRRRRTV